MRSHKPMTNLTSCSINKIVFPSLKDSISETIEVANYTPIDTVKKAGQYEYHQLVNLIVFDTGQIQLPQFQFLADNNGKLDTFLTDPITIRVAGVKIDTTKDIKDIKQALTYKSYHDGFATYIGIAADIHDDVQYLKDLAKKVTAAEVKSYYQHHKADFKRIERVKAQNINVSDEKTANMIIEQLKKGAKFADLAKQYSMAMDKSTGGDLGWIVHNRNNPNWLSTLAFVQPINIPSRPVRTPTGQWEILLVTAKEEGYHPANSETVRYLASQVIARQKMVKEYQYTRKNLIQQADIHISPILKKEMINLEKDVMIAKPSEEDHHHH